jgi:hypothetical protein
MDNKLNEILRKISRLRLEMLSLQNTIRLSVNNGLIWSEMATRLTAAQGEMLALIRQRNAIGGIEASSVFAARLRPSHRPELQRRIGPAKVNPAKENHAKENHAKENRAKEKPGRSRALSI